MRVQTGIMHVIYYTASSLDGYLADPQQSLAWLFAQEHTEPADPELRMDTLLSRTQALLMGSTTYEWIREEIVAEGWPYRQPTWVLSHRELESIEGAELRFDSGDVTGVLERIRAAVPDPDGVLWVVGGGELAGQLADVGLLDELIVSYAPVTLGAGAPLLPRRLQLRLRSSEVCADFICARYVVEGLRTAADWAP
ncbi:dihydrofolate reductase family protein [Rothia halotolerans]|uniref:dihydrofolate reductase family protein n=1 Tax=Rothia halotolerans TaxID=405770 RepID=UPI001EE0B2A4|nr:dihydrofolate reductase family protein [Rothia halotolerans]